MTSQRYLVAGYRRWNRTVFNDMIAHYPGQWRLISEREELTAELVRELQPRYLFFLHWSWLVPEEIFQEYECVCFHLADLPFGRGGSPVQNLIERGHQKTVLSAFRMTREIDAGPLYAKCEMSLGGGAEEIFIRASYLCAEMIRQIVNTEPVPVPQQGAPVVFPRRKPKDSEVPPRAGLVPLFDFIRMLDAEGYPRAYLTHCGFRYELSRAALYDGRIEADVTITPLEERE